MALFLDLASLFFVLELEADELRTQQETEIFTRANAQHDVCCVPNQLEMIDNQQLDYRPQRNVWSRELTSRAPRGSDGGLTALLKGPVWGK